MFDKQDLQKLVTMTMPFGKYQGRLLIYLPEEYLLWFAKKEFPQGELGRLMQLTLLIKVEGLQSLLQPLRQHRRHR